MLLVEIVMPSAKLFFQGKSCEAKLRTKLNLLEEQRNKQVLRVVLPLENNLLLQYKGQVTVF